MAGHSKWSNIKHRKAAQDKKRAKIFSRLIREITVAARQGSDPETNPRLRLAVDRALSSNMPKENIERAIRKGSGEDGGDALEEIRYEGYGPGGVAIMVDCVTDNRNRTVSEVRHAFTKHGGNLGEDGSVAYLFSHQGVLYYDEQVEEDALVEAALEAGADDVVNHEDGTREVITSPEEFHAVKQVMEAREMVPEAADLTMRPATTVPLDEEGGASVLKLLDWLEDLDDVQQVYSNADFPESVFQEAG